jgi:hypothetical protein
VVGKVFTYNEFVMVSRKPVPGDANRAGRA